MCIAMSSISPLGSTERSKHYLYAAFSLKRSVGDGTDAQEVDALSRWRRSITAVVIEE
jgi:hypothetical protein